nr:hypothetical protein [Tanacetum cinerariifolium]
VYLKQPDHGATMMMKGEKSKPSIELRLTTSEEDRISSLPDCLLVEIISRLPETKYAIRTVGLSYLSFSSSVQVLFISNWITVWLNMPLS